jgi:hypothetical protein
MVQRGIELHSWQWDLQWALVQAAAAEWNKYADGAYLLFVPILERVPRRCTLQYWSRFIRSRFRAKFAKPRGVDIPQRVFLTFDT